MSEGVKTSLATFMRDKRQSDRKDKSGPFVTISRQYGCQGYFLGLLLVDMLNTNEPGEQNPWKVYQREILERLASQTELPAEELNRLRCERPRLLVEFFRNLAAKRKLGGFEVRNLVAEVVRCMAWEGHVIIIGMGGAGATADMDNGLRVRLEAPKDWRVSRVIETEGVSPVEARLMVQRHDTEHEHLRQLYSMRFHREPAFDLVYDCSKFTLAQLTQHVVQAMKLKKMI